MADNEAKKVGMYDDSFPSIQWYYSLFPKIPYTSTLASIPEVPIPEVPIPENENMTAFQAPIP